MVTRPDDMPARDLARCCALPFGQASSAGGVEAGCHYAGADRQKVLEDGARREGSLLLYTTGTQIKPLLDRFEQKYSFVRLICPCQLGRSARKVVEEYGPASRKLMHSNWRPTPRGAA